MVGLAGWVGWVGWVESVRTVPGWSVGRCYPGFQLCHRVRVVPGTSLGCARGWDGGGDDAGRAPAMTAATAQSNPIRQRIWKTADMEDRGYGRQRVWKTEDMEDSGYGRQRIWKTADMEDRGYGRQRIWKTADMEDSGYGRQRIWKTADIYGRCAAGAGAGEAAPSPLDLWTTGMPSEQTPSGHAFTTEVDTVHRSMGAVSFRSIPRVNYGIQSESIKISLLQLTTPEITTPDHYSRVGDHYEEWNVRNGQCGVQRLGIEPACNV
eukprot:gene10174-biopygen6374